jgi:virginiamycin B lyase
VREFAVRDDSYPEALVAGSEGEIWFTEYDAGKIGRLASDGDLTEYEVPGGPGPSGITFGPDGNIWFTEYLSGAIGCLKIEG